MGAPFFYPIFSFTSPQAILYALELLSNKLSKRIRCLIAATVRCNALEHVVTEYPALTRNLTTMHLVMTAFSFLDLPRTSSRVTLPPMAQHSTHTSMMRCSSLSFSFMSLTLISLITIVNQVPVLAVTQQADITWQILEAIDGRGVLP